MDSHIVKYVTSIVALLVFLVFATQADASYRLSAENSETAIIKSDQGDAALAVMCIKNKKQEKAISVLLMINNKKLIDILSAMHTKHKRAAPMWIIFNDVILAAPTEQINHYLYLIIEQGKVDTIIPGEWENEVSFNLTAGYRNEARIVFEGCLR